MSRAERRLWIVAGVGVVFALGAAALRPRTMAAPSVTRSSTTPAREQSIVQGIAARGFADPTLLDSIRASF